MYSKIKIGGHPVHPMLVAYPVAFYTATFVCFIVYNSTQSAFWFKVAFVANTAGIVMAVIAALVGFIDWLAIPSQVPAKRVGVNHMIFNVIALTLFSICWFQQHGKWNVVQPDAGMAIILSGTGLASTITAGFLGWSLVQKHHVGVDPMNETQRMQAKTLRR